MSFIECRDFSFSCGQVRILEKISFRIDSGDWLFILGPNGSGKSTLLKNLLRLVPGVCQGSLRVGGRPVREYRQRDLARLLAYLPQAGGRLPPFTVAEFVRLSRYPFDPFAQSRPDGGHLDMERAFALTGTASLADRRLDQLSGGQRQRVFLAAALAQGTGALLLDEPAAFLDPESAFELNELLKRLHSEQGLTLLTVTHDLSQPLETGGKALALRRGRQIYFGPAEDLVANRVFEQAFNYQFSYVAHPRTGKTLVIA